LATSAQEIAVRAVLLARGDEPRAQVMFAPVAVLARLDA
jgi:hypothetical protein